MGDRDFIDSYLEYASEITDAPLIFHQFVGLSIGSAALGNRVFLRFGDISIYPNLWIVLLAPSSTFRKSTAIGIGARVLRSVNENLIYPTEFSQEKILEIIEKQSQGVFIYPEFMTLSGLLSRDYNAGLKAFLTEIYDSPPFYIRKTISRSYEIRNPCISILSATTQEWFLKKLNEDDLRGGFLPRFIFVPANTKEKSLAFPRLIDMSKKNALAHMLKGVSELEGEMKFSPEAEKFYREWFQKYETGIDGGLLTGFYSRLETYMLKLAILIESIRNRSLLISEKSVREAGQLANFLTGSIRKMADKDFVFTRFQRDKRKVEELIKSAGSEGIARKDLLKKSKVSADYLNKMIETLMQEQTINVETVKGGTKPFQVYRYNSESSPIEEIVPHS